MYGVKVPEYFEEFKALYFTEAIDMFPMDTFEIWKKWV